MEERIGTQLPDPVKGTCEFMCPEKERNSREKENLLNHFEVAPGANGWFYPDDTLDRGFPLADPLWVVKSYVRSGVGQEMSKACDLRPPKVLKQTIYHLLHNIVPRTEDWADVYKFVFNRLRAVRQDMVIQNLNTKDSIAILEPIARFHAYAGYRLCEEPVGKFEPKINQSHLSECLRRLAVLYDDLEKEEKEEEEQEEEDEEEEENMNFEARSEMEAMHLALDLGSSEVLKRALLLDKQLKTPELLTVMEMSFQYREGNYARVCKLMTTLPPILACVAVQHLPAIRRRALLVMSSGFSSRVLQYPVSNLCPLLLYHDEEEARKECQRFNIQVQDTGITFLKGTFDNHVELSPPHHIRFTDEALAHCYIPLLLSGRWIMQEHQKVEESRQPLVITID